MMIQTIRNSKPHHASPMHVSVPIAVTPDYQVKYNIQKRKKKP